MVDRPSRGRALPVPSHRLSRLAGFGRLTAGIAGRTLVEGARSLGRGELPSPASLLLTPANLLKISDELARMRGAALKLGQLMSMDAGEILPRELADLMVRLRADADFMPASQLNAVLAKNLGADWEKRFEYFEKRPIAAASIGQVHRARTTDGRDLAIKVQYPGVARSIDSDIDNVVSLFRLSGIAPPSTKLEPLVAETKAQLHEEADYEREAGNIRQFNARLSGNEHFALPVVHEDFSTGEVLAMSFVPGQSIEAAEGQNQEVRDRIFTRLVCLALDELFDFRFVQTDPNFANYTYHAAGDRIGLLDFGAARAFSRCSVERYRRFLLAGLEGDRERLRIMAVELSLYTNQTDPRHRHAIDRMIFLLFGAVRRNPIFDFSDDDLLRDLRAVGMDLALDREFVEVPPVEVLYLQRKAAGLFLLGRRLRARIPLRSILQEYAQRAVQAPGLPE